MRLIKNITLVQDLEDGIIQQMEKAASILISDDNIRFKIVEYEPTKIIIQAAQDKNSSGIYHSQKGLIEIVQKTFDRFFIDKKLHVHAIPFKDSPVNKVNAKWITEQLKERGLKLKVLAEDTGIRDYELRNLITGKEPLTQYMKALFYYYFLAKDKEG